MKTQLEKNDSYFRAKEKVNELKNKFLLKNVQEKKLKV